MISKRETAMNQLGLGLNLSTKKTRKREFLDEMNRVVPWAALVAVVEPYAPRAKTGRPPFATLTMLRIHYLQQWFGLGPGDGRSAARRAAVPRVHRTG